MFNQIEKAFLVLTYAETKSITISRRRFRTVHQKNPPSRKSILLWVQRFRDAGSLDRIKRRDNRADVLLNEVLAVREILSNNNYKISIRKMASTLMMSKSKVQRLLKIIKFKAYKIQTFQRIIPHAYEQRYYTCETILDLTRQFPNAQIIMSDEATFHLNGKVNKHNCRIWGDENPREFVEFERDSPKVNVWCAVSSTKVYGPFFFMENTVFGANYTDMLELFFYPQLEEEGIINDIYFQQDGAPAHYSNIARNSLDRVFPNRWIGRGGPIPWAPYSPDLTIPDFFLWGYVKEKCYNPLPRNLEELKINIRNVIELIPQEMFQNSYGNFLYRLTKCVEVNGGHIQQLL